MKFTTTVVAGPRGRVVVPVPFDPDEEWGHVDGGRGLAPDLAAALEASPAAGAFFDSLAQFYRRAYLRWVDGTKRRPELRAARIAELVELLEAGHEERPR